MASPRVSELDELRAVEERLLRERAECERLEAQIRALAQDSDRVESSLDARTRSGAHAHAQSYSQAYTQPSTYGYTQQRPGPSPDARAPATVAVDVPSSSREAESALDEFSRAFTGKNAAGQQQSQQTNGALVSYDRNGYAGGDRAPAGSRSPTPGKVTYRSALYRSASPSKRVHKDGVVISNFSRASRFRDDKSWVPGPGKYHPHETDFSPVTGPAAADKEGVLGHTWADYFTHTRVRASPRAAHEAAMAAATARIGGKGSSTEPGLSETMTAVARAHELTEHGADEAGAQHGSETMTAAVSALIAASNGNARHALELALRRERTLRREVENYRRQLTTQRMSGANTTGQMRMQIEDLTRKLAKRSGAYDALVVRVDRLRDAFAQVETEVVATQQGLNELGAGLAAGAASELPDYSRQSAQDAMSRVLSRYPALARTVDCVRRLGNAMQTMEASLSSALTMGQETRQAQQAEASTPAEQRGYVGYSSLSGALSHQQEIGTLGASERVMQGTPRGASKASPAVLPAAKEGLAASQQPTRTGQTVDLQAKGISASDVAAFTRRARRASSAKETEAALASAVVEAERRGYDVEKVQATAMAEAAELRAVTAPERRSPPASSGASHAGSASVSRGRSASNRRASLAASISAAVGRAGSSPSPSAPGTVSGSSVAGSRVTSPSSIPMLRRMSAGVVEMPALLPASPLGVKETTVAETLAQIFAYYSRFGDRDSEGNTLRLQQFVRLVRDAGIMDSRLTPADVDMAFTRAVSQAGGRGGSAARMTFEHCVTALNELAVRKYRGVDKAPGGQSGVSADPEAFRQLLQDHVLPVYQRLKYDALFVTDVAAAGSAELTNNFAEEFLKPEVIEFFNEHRSALQGIFMSYATTERSAEDGSRPTPPRDGVMRMSRKGLLQFAHDYKIVPEMLTRPELLQLVRDALRALGRSDTGDELTYPEWIEVLGMVAQAVASAKVQTGRSLVTALGAEDAAKLRMVGKLQLLFMNMYELGARFNGDAAKMIRTVTRDAKAEVEALNQKSSRTTRESQSLQARRVQDVLLEGIRV